ncbi:MAG: hypothetical protein ABSB58_04885 [Gemmatimonadales bacterium]|jgi:hypothetical protein
MTTPTLTRRQCVVLAAVCDTFVPPAEAPRGDDPDGHVAASPEDAQLLDRIERLIGPIADHVARGILETC